MSALIKIFGNSCCDKHKHPARAISATAFGLCEVWCTVMPKDLTRVCVQVIYCVVFLQGKTEFGEIKVKK